MKLLKYFPIFIFIIFSFSLFTTISVAAAPPLLKSLNDKKSDYISPAGKGTVENVSQVVKITIDIVRWAYTIFFIIAVFMILMAAYTYLTAQANPEKITKATNQIIWASVAIAVALIAVSVNVIVRSFIGGNGGGGGGTPTSPTYNSSQTGGAFKDNPNVHSVNLPTYNSSQTGEAFKDNPNVHSVNLPTYNSSQTGGAFKDNPNVHSVNLPQ